MAERYPLHRAFGTPLTVALTLALLVAAASGGCTTARNFIQGEDNNEPPTPLEEFEPSVAIEVVWSQDVGDGVGTGGLALTPQLAGDRVYAADADGEVQAFEAETGKRLWSVDTDVTISGGPGTDGDIVVVGSDNGEVIAMLAGAGDRLWQARVSSEVLATPRISEGVVVIRTVDGKLFGLSAVDGSQLWVYDRTVPVLSLRGTSTPSIARGLVVGGFDNGRLVAVSLHDGQPAWEARIATPSGRTELERIVDIDAAPLILDEVAYVVTYQGRVAAVDLITGEPLWRRDMSSYAGLGVDYANVYVTDAQDHVWALDRRNSASLWRQQKLQHRRLTAPTRFGDYVVVGDLEGYVHWLRNDDGQFAARAKAGSTAVVAQPVAGESLLYVYTGDGTLTAFRLGAT